MPTQISSSASSSDSSSRQVARFSNGDLVAGVADSANNNVVLYVSTDDGSSWSNEGTCDAYIGTESSGSFTSTVRFGLSVDSADNVRISSRDPASATDIIYNQFSYDSSNVALTQDVTNEIAYSAGNNVGQSTIVVSSADTPYIAFQYLTKVMGTLYFYLRLVERASAGSWNDLGNFAGSSADHTKVSAAADSVDDIHVSWRRGTVDAMWTEYVQSSGSFATNETIKSNLSASVGDTAVMVDSSNDEPLVTYNNDDVLSGGAIARRVSGSWDDVAYSSDAVTEASLTYANGDIHIVFRDANDDIAHNSASSYDMFDTANQTALVSSADTLTEPTVRWQQYNENDPPNGDIVDFTYFDSTNGNLSYSATAGQFTDTGSVTTASGNTLQALSGFEISGVVDVGGTTTSGVKVYISQVDEGNGNANLQAEVTTNSDGSYSAWVNPEYTAHVAAQYDDGTDKWAGDSKPYIEEI